MYELILAIVIVILGIILTFVILHVFALKEEIAQIQYLKRSQSVKYGQLTEQWIPFTKDFPFDTQNFRFIGKPIDGVAFEDDKIVFVEFKANNSTLSEVQRKVKKLVEDKKIEWFELKIK